MCLSIKQREKKIQKQIPTKNFILMSILNRKHLCCRLGPIITVILLIISIFIHLLLKKNTLNSFKIKKKFAFLFITNHQINNSIVINGFFISFLKIIKNLLIAVCALNFFSSLIPHFFSVSHL